MRNKFLILLLFISTLLVALSSEEKHISPDIYEVIETNNWLLNNHEFYGINLSLPYFKPAGITEIFNPEYSDMEAILIEKLVVDGILISKTAGMHGYDPGDIEVTKVDPGGSRLFYFLELYMVDARDPYFRFDFWDFDPETSYLRQMIPLSEIMLNEPSSARSFRIPIDAQEAFMTYRIVFPNGMVSESETVYWKFNLPESLE